MIALNRTVILSGPPAPNEPVILSGVNASRSEAFTQSKDPLSLNISKRPRKAFSPHSAPAFVRTACAALLLTILAAAQTLTGTIKNSTTAKPATSSSGATSMTKTSLVAVGFAAAAIALLG